MLLFGEKYWRFCSKYCQFFVKIGSLCTLVLRKTPIFSPKIGKNRRKLEKIAEKILNFLNKSQFCQK
jgi:hypothetical protein